MIIARVHLGKLHLEGISAEEGRTMLAALHLAVEHHQTVAESARTAAEGERGDDRRARYEVARSERAWANAASSLAVVFERALRNTEIK